MRYWLTDVVTFLPRKKQTKLQKKIKLMTHCMPPQNTKKDEIDFKRKNNGRKMMW